ncbi:MAG: DUF192 domain-containing protein [Candidatus Paceibacterales bacterium]
MTKKTLFFFLLVSISVFLVIPKIYQDNLKKNRVCFNNYCFYVELADNQTERALGLMFREGLELNKGMLFVFEEEEEHSFWMKNTLIPLDIIWINEEKEVVFIKKNAQPCTEKICKDIEPGKKAKYVLEVNAGMVEKINLKIGDRLNFDINLTGF